MTAALPDRIRTLEEQERELVLDRFDQDDAWTLGSLIVDAARAARHGVLIDIRRPNFTLFRAALPGTAPDQELWAGRKAAVVLRMETSSALFAARMKSAQLDPAAMGWLDSGYALAGGSFPIRVSGVGVVAAVSASGLSSDDDHNLVVDGLRALLAAR
jgi:uncharacterized protein (UPF0303 family)